MTDKKKEQDLEEIEAEVVDQVEEIEEEIKEEPKADSENEASLKESLARLQADFINYKNRTEKEKSNIHKYANEGLILKLLSVVDNMDRALANADEEDSFVAGIVLIRDEFLQVLENEGLKEIESDGAKFDPNFHHAVFIEENDEVESKNVIETFQKGYMIDEKVIRPAMVKVAK